MGFKIRVYRSAIFIISPWNIYLKYTVFGKKNASSKSETATCHPILGGDLNI